MGVARLREWQPQSFVIDEAQKTPTTLRRSPTLSAGAEEQPYRRLSRAGEEWLMPLMGPCIGLVCHTKKVLTHLSSFRLHSVRRFSTFYRWTDTMWVDIMLKYVETRLVDLLTPHLRWKGLKRVEFLERDPEQWSSWLNLV
jgi:hypothetical protein